MESSFFKKRNKTREVKIGNLKVGGNNPVRIKAMLKTSLKDVDGVIRETVRLKKEGAEAIRIAVEKKSDAKIVRLLKKEVPLPFAADVHFDYCLALAAIEEGFDEVRLNPLNIYKKKQIREVVKELKKAGISLRVGINSGGFKKDFSSAESIAKDMVVTVSEYIKIIEKEEFFDIMVSLKTSSVESTIIANNEFARRFDYPVHLGVTATGPFLEGIVKSSMGIATMLSNGIGDIIRVSLTDYSWKEIEVAKSILQFLGLRNFFPEVISCPTCSRCNVDLPGVVNKFRKAIDKVDKTSFPHKIAIMGCVVNGPGEAYQADIGVAFGKKKAAIFRKDKVIGWTDEKNALNDLLAKIKEIKWQ